MRTVRIDGDQEHDFIKGLGLRFAVPMHEEVHNRHVRLAGERTGVFAEPIRWISGNLSPGAEIYARQIAGERVPALADLRGSNLVAQLPVWNDFKLSQVQADGFLIEKRTGSHSAWIEVAGGTRLLGLASVGDASGGLALGMKRTSGRDSAPRPASPARSNWSCSPLLPCHPTPRFLSWRG